MNLEIKNGDVSSPNLGTLSLNFPTYYDVLNIDSSSTRMMIREAYLRLKNLYSNGGEGLYGMAGPEDLHRHLTELEKAFEVLNDDTSRAVYDRKLAGTSEPTKAAPQQEWTHEADQWQPIPQIPLHSTGGDVIQTSRSTLRVMKTHASGSNKQELQDKFIALLEEADIADGSVLVNLRELAGVSQMEIQERTKISLEYIRGMENNRFERLPQVVYIKGFIRSYLRYLNVPNLDKIVTAYAARLEAWQAGQK